MVPAGFELDRKLRMALNLGFSCLWLPRDSRCAPACPDFPNILRDADLGLPTVTQSHRMHEV